MNAIHTCVDIIKNSSPDLNPKTLAIKLTAFISAEHLVCEIYAFFPMPLLITTLGDKPFQDDTFSPFQESLSKHLAQSSDLESEVLALEAMLSSSEVESDHFDSFMTEKSTAFRNGMRNLNNLCEYFTTYARSCLFVPSIFKLIVRTYHVLVFS